MRRTLLDTNRPNHLQVSQAHQNLLHPIHLQRVHTAADGACKQLGHPGTLLNGFFSGVVGNHQFAQTYAAFVVGFIAFVAADTTEGNALCG